MSANPFTPPALPARPPRPLPSIPHSSSQFQSPARPLSTSAAPPSPPSALPYRSHASPPPPAPRPASSTFAPPPLPPRPDAASLPPAAPSPHRLSRKAPPPIPESARETPTQAPLLAPSAYIAQQPTFSEKPSSPFRPKEVRRKWGIYPTTRRGRLVFWALAILLLLAIIVVVAVLASVLPSHSSSSSSSSGGSGNSTDNGGHPLSAEEGGVVKGQPGDWATFGENSTDHFVMNSNRSSYLTRLDPIVNPGAVGSHVHRVHGSSYFTQNLTSATAMQALGECSTAYIQDDKSLYWVPQVYYRFPGNGSLIAYPVTLTSIYYFQKAPTGWAIEPFPDNYNIVSGDPMRRSLNMSSPSINLLWWVCWGIAGKGDSFHYGFPDKACPGGIKQIVTFPSCWDGVYADDADYSSHVVFPSQNYSLANYCPESHPKRFITIQFETVFNTNVYPYNGAGEITYVLSNGDTTGYGIHGDFMNGWKPETLQGFIDDCKYMNSTSGQPAPDRPENCPHLAKSISPSALQACTPQSPVVNEDVGAFTPISSLPGCNDLWTANMTAKPGCLPGHIDGGDLDLVMPTRVYEGLGVV